MQNAFTEALTVPQKISGSNIKMGTKKSELVLKIFALLISKQEIGKVSAASVDQFYVVSVAMADRLLETK